MTKLSKYEKETIINWNEAENTASIYTFNADLKRRLAEFSRKYPQLCRLERSTTEGSVTYVMDKSRLSSVWYRRTVRSGWRLPENTPNSTDFRSCGRTRRAPETGSIYRKMVGLHPVFCGELVTGYPCIPLPGNATKGAFRAGGADRNRTSVGSQLLRAGVRRAASPLCWV